MAISYLFREGEVTDAGKVREDTGVALVPRWFHPFCRRMTGIRSRSVIAKILLEGFGASREKRRSGGLPGMPRPKAAFRIGSDAR